MGVDARMMVVTKRSYTEQELLDLGWRLGEAVLPASLFHGEAYWSSEKRGCILHADEDERRSVDAILGDDDILYSIRLNGRYYGKGYERGDPWVYISIAVWTETNMAPCRVYYGGDSGDWLMEFGATERQELIAHWASVGHCPYTGAFDTDDTRLPPGCVRPISWAYGKPMYQNGSGGGFASFSCQGSGEEAIFRDGKFLTAEELKTCDMWGYPKEFGT